MRHFFVFLCSFYIFGVGAFNFSYGNTLIDYNNISYTEKQKKKIFAGDIFIQTEITSSQDGKTEKQEMKFSATGFHKKGCRPALRILSRYEDYSKWISFVKSSSYNKEKGRINLQLVSPLLPFNMIMDFVLPRVDRPGLFYYYFDQGFLNGLTGEIHVSEFENRCFFHGNAKWKGPHSTIPDIIFEFFVTTLAHVAVDSLLRISSK